MFLPINEYSRTFEYESEFPYSTSLYYTHIHHSRDKAMTCVLQVCMSVCVFACVHLSFVGLPEIDMGRTNKTSRRCYTLGMHTSMSMTSIAHLSSHTEDLSSSFFSPSPRPCHLSGLCRYKASLSCWCWTLLYYSHDFSNLHRLLRLCVIAS